MLKYLSLTLRTSPRLKLSSSSAVALKSYLAMASMVLRAFCKTAYLQPFQWLKRKKKNLKNVSRLLWSNTFSASLLLSMTRSLRFETSHKGGRKVPAKKQTNQKTPTWTNITKQANVNPQSKIKVVYIAFLVFKFPLKIHTGHTIQLYPHLTSEQPPKHSTISWPVAKL